MIIISGSAVSFHTHLLNSSLISSTLDGWQQMAQEDWAGSNNGAIYLCPTRIRSSNDTWGILSNRFLQKKKKKNQPQRGNYYQKLGMLEPWVVRHKYTSFDNCANWPASSSRKTQSECNTTTKAKSEFLQISHQCQSIIWPFIYENLIYSIDLHLPFTP